jgi:hypothetical protein
MGGFDPLSPMIYTYSRDKEGNIEGVQSETLLGNACSDTLFVPNTPGMWFTNQGEEVRVALSSQPSLCVQAGWRGDALGAS